MHSTLQKPLISQINEGHLLQTEASALCSSQYISHNYSVLQPFSPDVQESCFLMKNHSHFERSKAYLADWQCMQTPTTDPLLPCYAEPETMLPPCFFANDQNDAFQHHALSHTPMLCLSLKECFPALDGLYLKTCHEVIRQHVASGGQSVCLSAPVFIQLFSSSRGKFPRGGCLSCEVSSLLVNRI